MPLPPPNENPTDSHTRAQRVPADPTITRLNSDGSQEMEEDEILAMAREDFEVDIMRGGARAHEENRLAHSQLAELFKDMVLTDIGIKLGLSPALQGIALFFAFALWAIISVVVLMVMENLSSFLHALRLQWVEFQNKFFYGDGHKYTPFSFDVITAVEEGE